MEPNELVFSRQRFGNMASDNRVLSSFCNIDMTYRCVRARWYTGWSEGREAEAIKSMGLLRLEASVTMQPNREKRCDGRDNPDTYYR